MYTIAYRLTGREAAASDLALTALVIAAQECGWQPHKPVPQEMPLASIKEVFRLFLAQPRSGEAPRPASRVPMAGEPKEMLQAALLTLKPLERAAVVWRYVTGLQVDELAPVPGGTDQDLYRCLSRALYELFRWLKLAAVNGILNFTHFGILNFTHPCPQFSSDDNRICFSGA